MKLSLLKVFKEALEEVQEPETDEGDDPQAWIQAAQPEHSEEYVNVPVPKGWNRGNKSRSYQAIGRHAGNMNRRDVYPDTQKSLGWKDGNERLDKQRN